MDVLSDVLRGVRLSGALFFDVRVGTPFAAATPPSATIAPSVMPEAEHVIPYHLVLDGTCWAEMTDGSQPPARLETGDAVLFPQGHPHTFCSEPGLRAEPDMALYYRPTDRPLPFVLKFTEEALAQTRFVCGYLGCDSRPFNPLLESLPSMLLSRCPLDEKAVEVDLIRMAVDESESRSAGGESVLAKLSELMFLRALRRYIDRLPDGATGWLSGLRDRYVSAALGLMHGRPTEDWTLDRLAHEVGLSRSALSERFSEHVLMSPMRYLASWRMQLAARLLERPDMTVSRAAAAVGYHSEEGFNRAFKKLMGATPGEWRRDRTAPGDRPSDA